MQSASPVNYHLLGNSYHQSLSQEQQLNTSTASSLVDSSSEFSSIFNFDRSKPNVDASTEFASIDSEYGQYSCYGHEFYHKEELDKKDPIIEFDKELADAIERELGLKKQNGPRKNSWGNLSYAELITKAIESSAEQRLTLSQIYDWIVRYVPYFKEKFDRTSSAGWKVTFVFLLKG